MAHVINTASGLALDLDRPLPDQIALEDIAGGLSRICRFGAQASRFHSVAQHAVLVSELLVAAGRSELALAGLHHDSHEAFVGDLPAPLKRKLRAGGERLYDEVCDALDGAIAAALGIPVPADADKRLIKLADDEALMIEAAALLPDGGAGVAAATGLTRQPADRLAASLAPVTARGVFLARHRALAGG